ncbi:hypothetical protein HYH02_010647 [Chlamydomonas schloesseri]|uniref:Intradiol ring-cleavage dioxygenases domain-containing protein n=1 Tax=Chlamydomonas schloesseri TaxID=2026947 RepID=A0A835TJ61_9CHLO|nr:hypothetical protein HYH02_010647 [Chlamydomonas schloesseri]|eukprot:KAG2439770.1 hypothetical protein HYH02_010647 [Chlamydomonas schloesseri]
MACSHAAATARLLQQDAAISDAAALIDRSRPNWYVTMELRQQQQEAVSGKAALMKLDTAATELTSPAQSTAEAGTATRAAANLVRAAAADTTPGHDMLRSGQRPPPPKPLPSPSRSCIATASDAPGPFYQAQGVPLNTKPDESFCALKAGGMNTSKITITGKVLQSTTCTPVTGISPSSLAFIDVWQANNAGEYDNNRDTTTSECRSRVPIGPDGSYKYTTIVPAAYGARTCLRPPHIHLRLALPGYATLVTQMYFAGNPLNGPNDCGCSSCGSGNPLQQVAINPATRAGVFNILLTRQR